MIKIYPTIGFVEIIYSFIFNWLSIITLQYSNLILNDTLFDN
jgi:hypothetical protein